MRKHFLLSSCLLIFGSGLFFSWAERAQADITATKHNLSATAPHSGAYRASAEERICLVCHTPHNALPAGPLWNHTLSGVTNYTPYSSDTLIAAPEQPTGKSKLCLACHDGTVATGSIHNMPGVPANRASNIDAGVVSGLESVLSGASNLTTDLSDDHPVSFQFDSNLFTQSGGELVDPTLLTETVKLENGEVQCTSCHDPHESVNPKFLQKALTDGGGYGSPLCMACHDKLYWETPSESKHRTSLATWTGSGTDPWHLDADDSDIDTVKENGCENCHKPHAGGAGDRRLLKGDGESALCMVCHNGNVTDGADPTINMSDLFNDAINQYNHPSLDGANDGRHLPVRDLDHKVREGALGDDPNTLGTSRHAECQDCHNPHASYAGVSPDIDGAVDANYPNQGTSGVTPGGTSMDASPVLKGVWGVRPIWPSAWGSVVNYTDVDDIEHEYQLCLKCHSYYAFGNIPPTDPWSEFDWISQSYTYPIGGGTGTIPGWDGDLTDQAQEFNPNNPSSHRVATDFATWGTSPKNDFIFDAGTLLAGTSYKASLVDNLSPNSTMGCSDCHSDSTVVGTKGSHGSDVWPILWADYDGTEGQAGTFDHLCFKCHKATVYGDSAVGADENAYTVTGFSNENGTRRNLHAFHANDHNVPTAKDYGCNTCHAAVPHGWKRKALLIYGLKSNSASSCSSDPAPYNAHARYNPEAGKYAYGIPCEVGDVTVGGVAGGVDAISSGQWEREVCHGTGADRTIGDCS